MKTKHQIKIVLAITISFFIKLNLTFGQGTGIIAFVSDSSSSAIVRYDYVSQTLDTLHNITGPFVFLNEESSIDFLNGRYFFCASLTGYPHYTVFSYNIYNDSLIPLFQMNFGPEQGIEYDYFTNSLIYRDNVSLKRFDISTGTKTTICSIPYSDCSWLYAGFKRAYNYLFQQYLYITDLTGNFDMFYVLVDVNNGIVIDTTHLSNNSSWYINYDIITNSFYGMINGGKVAKINPLNGTSSHVCSLPSDFYGMLNEQEAVFNSFTGQYIIPYYSISNDNKLAIINENDSTISQVTSFPANTNFHRLFQMQIPMLKTHNNSIIASYASYYYWYLNNTLISGLNSQSIIPSSAGYYKVREMFFDGRFAFSDSIYFNPLSIDNNSILPDNFKFYPNPASDNLTIEVAQRTEIEISNIEGQIIQRLKTIDNKTDIDISDFTNGVYIIRAQTGRGIMTKKFIKE